MSDEVCVSGCGAGYVDIDADEGAGPYARCRITVERAIELRAELAEALRDLGVIGRPS